MDTHNDMMKPLKSGRQGSFLASGMLPRTDKSCRRNGIVLFSLIAASEI